MGQKSITTFFLLSEEERNALCASETSTAKLNFIGNEHIKIMNGVLIKYTEEPGVTEVVIPEGIIGIDHPINSLIFLRNVL